MDSHSSLTSQLLAAAESAEAIQRRFDLEHREALEACAVDLARILGGNGRGDTAGRASDEEPKAGLPALPNQLLAPLVPPRQILERMTLEARYDLVEDRQRAGFLGIRALGVGYGRRFTTSTASSTTLRIEVVATPNRSTSTPSTSEPETEEP